MKGIDPKWTALVSVLVAGELAIGHGTVSLTNALPANWIPVVQAWCNILAFFGSSLAGVMSLYSSNASGLLTSTGTPTVPPIAKIIILAIVSSTLLFAQSAQAKPLAVTGNPVKDIKTDLGLDTKPATGVTKATDGTVSCSFNVFANLTPKNLIATIQACVSDANSTFEPDVAAALTSAQAYAGGTGDQTAIQCLQPALAIVQAGIEKSAVAAVAAVPAQPNATPPVAAVAAVVAVPAYKPGPIVLFQKFREFTLAGGPTACQNWVNGTINGVVAPVAGAAVGAAGAAVLLAP